MHFPKLRPLVSIVLPSYNHEAYIKKSVLTALDQGLGRGRLELVMVDDGSTDRTPDIVENLHDDRITIVRLPVNRLIHPRNLGLKMARGKYIAFQNSDDLWRKKKLKQQIAYMEANKKCVACFTEVSIIDSKGGKIENSWANGLFTTTNRSRHEWLRHFFEKGNCLCISSALIRSSAINKIGPFKSSLSQASDLDLWVRLAAIGDLHIIDQPLTSMRVLKDQNISRPTLANQRRFGIEFTEILSRFAEPKLARQLPQIFEDCIPQDNIPTPVVLAALSRHAWGLSASHKIFADRLLARLLDNSKNRQIITDYYGVDVVKKFLSQRGQLEVVFVEDSKK